MDSIVTRISTNQDPSLDVLMLTQGHPMVPSLGVLNLAYAPSGTLFDQTIELLGQSGQFKILHAGFYGIYGPAWAARADIDATLESHNTQITMKVTKDALKAGIQWGASHSFNFRFIRSEYAYDHWDWGPVFTWRQTDEKSTVLPLD
ncbi:MAG: hypothetical protein Q8M76_18950, partial [Spirochaetaceae bacterium]|nr:hypothetical protein [Spirochaetaceae bacterium]